MADWTHAPPHRFNDHGTYIVTAATYQKVHLFHSEERLQFLHESLLSFALKYRWHLSAWAVFVNHYHFIAQSDENSSSLKEFLSDFHFTTAKSINDEDGISKRKVWHNFWDTKLTFHASYFARLRYVNENPVRHGLVSEACLYPWCSANWFKQNSSSEFRKRLESFNVDNLNVPDDF